ncbi:hypothetical protein BC941DRAFT_426805 [Chlamydoabsidia padenii]|nr:hypothetical protein BC941DRAFT_426805 [Chlamydoabsidia padenii]
MTGSLDRPRTTNSFSVKKICTGEESILNTSNELTHSPKENDDDNNDNDTHRSWSPVIKPRRRFSTDEIRFLEEEYFKDINPSSDYLQMIANKLGTTRRVITTWFQNHRAKGKRTYSHKKIITKDCKSNTPQRKDIKGKMAETHICMNSTEVEYHPISFPAPCAPDPAPATLNMHNDPSHHHNYYPYSHHYYQQQQHYFDDITPSDDSFTSNQIDGNMSAWNTNVHPQSTITQSDSFWDNWHPSSTPLQFTTPYHNNSEDLYNQLSHPPLPQCCLVELYTGSPCPFHSFYSV